MIIDKLKKSDEMSKQIIINVFFTFIIKGLGIFISLFTMPAYMKYFENQKVLGLWFTLLSILSWVLTFDLGIGNGLRNKLIKPLIDSDVKEIKTYISSAYAITIIIVISFFIIGKLFIPLINWNAFLNISSNIISQDILIKAINILLVGILMQFLFKLIYSIFYALQKSSLPNFLSLVSSILLLLFVTYSKSGNIENNIINLSKANVYLNNIPLLLATILAFSTKLKKCRPNLKHVNIGYSFNIMKLGWIFFWLQLMSLLLTSTNELLISWLSGTENVVIFQIYNKLFSLISTIFALALTPIWSAVTKAYTKKDFNWLKSLYKRIRYMALVFIGGEFLLIFLLQIIVDFWLGEKSIYINYTYAIIFALSGSLYIWHSSITSIVNGIGKLKIQFIFLTIGGIINIPVAYLLYRFTGSWISIVGANMISLIPYCIIQPIYIKKYLNLKEEN